MIGFVALTPLGVGITEDTTPFVAEDEAPMMSEDAGAAGVFIIGAAEVGTAVAAGTLTISVDVASALHAQSGVWVTTL